MCGCQDVEQGTLMCGCQDADHDTLTWLSGCRAGYFDVCGCLDADQDTLMCVVVRM